MSSFLKLNYLTIMKAKQGFSEKKVDEVSMEKFNKKSTRKHQKLFEKRIKEWNKSRKPVKLRSLVHSNKSGKKSLLSIWHAMKIHKKCLILKLIPVK